jgi:transcriptional repressor NrdR
VICPYCEHNDDKVIDSRASEGGNVVRRRRECLKCRKRFTTYERVEESARLVVLKRDGTHVPFNRENVLRGVFAACGKRPVAEGAKQRIVDEVEEELHREFEREVPSRVIGEKVMARLRDLDEVAYVRYASEYYQFQNVGQFVEELKGLDGRIKDVKDQQRLFEERGRGHVASA